MLRHPHKQVTDILTPDNPTTNHQQHVIKLRELGLLGQARRAG